MSLLEASFLGELEALRRRLAASARSGGPGERRARRRGGSAEFAEHRSYAPGDDLRRVDWLAFARTGGPVLKLFRAEEDVVVRLLLDASSSLSTGTPPKIDVAKRLAAALAYMALAESERAQVLIAREGLEAARDPVRGRAALPRVLRELEALSPSGRTDLAAAVESVIARVPRPGMLVVLSDFMDPGPWDRALARAGTAGHDIALVQVLSADELAPPWDGDIAFVDSETGSLVEITVDDAARRAYLARLDALFRTLAAAAKRARGSYVRAAVGDDLLAVVRRVVGRAVD